MAWLIAPTLGGAHLTAAVNREGLNVVAEALNDGVHRQNDVHGLDHRRERKEVPQEVLQDGLDLVADAVRHIEGLHKVSKRVHCVHLRWQVPAARRATADIAGGHCRSAGGVWQPVRYWPMASRGRPSI